METFEKFSDKLKETIRSCREWRVKASGARPSTTATKPAAPAGTSFEDMDDDIPFITCSMQHDMAPRLHRRMARYSRSN